MISREYILSEIKQQKQELQNLGVVRIGLIILSVQFYSLLSSAYAQEIIFDSVPKKGAEWKQRTRDIIADSAVWKSNFQKRIAYLRNFTGLEIGADFPANDYVDINGDTIPESIFFDKTVVINFWIIGCRGCKQEEKALKKVTEHYKNSNQVVFIGFCRASKRAASNYLKRHGETGYRTIAGIDKREFDRLFNIITYPTHFIVKNGKIVDNFTETLPWESDIKGFIEIIDRHLK